MMTVKDLLAMEEDIDVYDDVCEELGIAFCGPMRLTDAGLEKFSEVLGYEIEINPHGYGGYPAAIVHVDDPDETVWHRKLRKAMEFFHAAAGYCDCDDYDRWFADED